MDLHHLIIHCCGWNNVQGAGGGEMCDLVYLFGHKAHISHIFHFFPPLISRIYKSFPLHSCPFPHILTADFLGQRAGGEMMPSFFSTIPNSTIPATLAVSAISWKFLKPISPPPLPLHTIHCILFWGLLLLIGMRGTFFCELVFSSVIWCDLASL